MSNMVPIYSGALAQAKFFTPGSPSSGAPDFANPGEFLHRLEELNDPALRERRLQEQNAQKVHTVFRKNNEIIAVVFREGGILYPQGGDVAGAQAASQQLADQGLQGEKFYEALSEEMLNNFNARVGGVTAETYSVADAPTYGEMSALLFGNVTPSVPLADETAQAALNEAQDNRRVPAAQAPEPMEDEGADSILPIGTQHGLEDVANDPEYAAEMAELWGTHHELILIPEHLFPKNGAPESEWAAFKRLTDRVKAAMNDARDRREAFYNQKVAEGLPPDEIYAQMLDFIANDDGFNAFVDNLQEKPPGSRKAMFTAMHDHLRDAQAERDVAMSESDPSRPLPSETSRNVT